MKTVPKFTPHIYQKKAIEFLLGQYSGGLFLDPGLGKTLVTLEVIKKLLAEKKIHRTLIIAPLRVAHNTWPDEIQKWLDFEDLTYTILHGPKKLNNLHKEVDIYLINPEGLPWLLKQYDPEWVPKSQRESKRAKTPSIEHDFDMLVVDESSQFKHQNTNRFDAIKTILDDFDRKVILTGSPVANGLMGIFGQMYILDGGASLGRYITHFRNKYFDQSGFNGFTYTPRPDAQERIYDVISPYVLSMSAEDYLELPELVETNIPVTLPPKALKFFKDVKKHLIAELEDNELVAGTAGVAAMKCRQIANGGVYLKPEDRSSLLHLHDEKTLALRSLINDLEGAPALVAYEFQHDLERIRKEFGNDIPHIGSGVSQKETSKIITAWNAGDIPMLVGNPISMAHGLNMQKKGRAVIWYSIPHDLEIYEQFIKRVWRQGQTERVFLYHILAKGTLDGIILRNLRNKNATQRSFLSMLKEEL